MKGFSRRDLLKISGAGLTGIALSGLSIPAFTLRKAYGFASDTAWRFGVMADTQWRTGSNSGGEPASCAVSIIDALNNQFIQHGCKFVVQVGDLVDKEVVDGIRTLPTRELHARALYNAGIGFFPVRGNHEATAIAANEIPVLFPQTLGDGPNLFGATNFQSISLPSTATDAAGERLKGLTYAFDYGNVRCVLIDQFVRKDGTCYNPVSKPTDYNNNAVDQVDWVDSVLSSNSPDRHSFVFSHKNLIGQNHKDVLFGSSLTTNPEARDRFISSLYNNSVGYHMSGHDHMHHYSAVKAGDDMSCVRQIICASNSYKFYDPREGDDGRETPFGQELFTLGYYIVTVDGPRVTVDYYSSSHGRDYGDFDLVLPPAQLNFFLRERFGYSLNGKRFEVAQGESYSCIEDYFDGTAVRILSGQNGNAETDRTGRPLVKNVATGWAESSAVNDAVGPIFSLWGMADNLSLFDQGLGGMLPNQDESQKCDEYVLSMTFDRGRVHPSQAMGGKLVIAARDDYREQWINAVRLNYGGENNFRRGPWKPQYGLGTYGVDLGSSTVWAVLNHSGDFVVKLQQQMRESGHFPNRAIFY